MVYQLKKNPLHGHPLMRVADRSTKITLYSLVKSKMMVVLEVYQRGRDDA